MALYPMNHKPTTEEVAALRTFAQREGRRWKSILRGMWMNAYYPGHDELTGILQTLRNEEFDLGKFRFPDEYKSLAAREAQQAGYGTQSYWEHLDASAEEMDAKGIPNAFTRTLAEALRGNNGD
jgi:hypothetical protein